jgi:4-azaleucine resistance transporter AzlC
MSFNFSRLLQAAPCTVSTPRQEFLAGVRATLPIMVGDIPFGMIYGVLALDAGMSPAAAQAMSAIVFAGSAQFITAQLVQGAAPAIVIVLTIAIVNLRHALYSASVAPYIKHLHPLWKALLAYLLTDEAYAVTILHYETDRQPACKHWFFLGSGLALWSSWQICTAAGILLGAVVPESWSLDFTLPLTFIALVVPNLKDKPGAAAALSAGLVAVLAFNLPYKLGLILAALTGILVGLWAENSQRRSLPSAAE